MNPDNIVYFSTTYDDKVRFYSVDWPIQSFINAEGKLKIDHTERIYRLCSQEEFRQGARI